jgi:tetratricopeptide (TPR) repeat protein
MRRDVGITILLVAITAAVFWPLVRFDFINFDDPSYVYDNKFVRGGLSLQSLGWAVTSIEQANWHPLTWLSHMLDWQLFGSWAGGHHLTSALLHTAGTVLLFWLLKRMTGAPWPSAAVAALFAVHPLHVESVAWVSERKDVLSTLFGLLALLCYVRYAERPGVGRYLWVAVLFAASLMCKPMLVTLPCVMLLLDYWPLRRYPLRIANCELRIQTAPARGLFKSAIRNPQSAISFARTTALRLILEKLPLFALVAASSIMAFITQRHGGAMKYAEQLPFLTRLANAPVVYVTYLGKTVWPTALALFYPYTERPVWQAVLATALLAAITAGVVWQIRRRPYLAVGWFWYLGMLVPVIGLVQVGEQSMADRYTYLPLVGIFIMGVWGARDLAAGRRAWQVGLVCAFAAALVACAALAQQQVACWKDSKTLLEHDIEAAGDNPMARGNLGVFYMDDTRLEKSERLRRAMAEFRRALELNSRYVFAHNNLGLALAEQDNLSEAIDHYRIALQIDPRHAPTHNNLGMALARQDNLDMAIRHYREAIDLRPDYAKAYNNLASALHRQGKVNEAIDGFRRAIALDRRYARPHNNLGMVLAQLGLTDEAIAEYREGLRLDPENAKTHNNLGLAWLDKGDAAAAAAEFEAALTLSPGMTDAMANLAGARARLRGAGAP